MARIKLTKKGLDGDARAEKILQVLESAAQRNYGESLWDSETGLVSGAKREALKAAEICLYEKCDAEETIEDIDDILYSLFGETLFEEEQGLIYGARQEVIDEVEKVIASKAEDLHMEDPEDKLGSLSMIIEKYKKIENPTMADRLETLEKVIEEFEK